MMLESAAAMVAVKQERPDDAEIQEMAEKIKESNKAKMATPGTVVPGARLTVGVGGQTTLAAYAGARSAVAAAAAATPSTSNAVGTAAVSADKKPIDEDSQRGRFGWCTIGTVPIPYILRGGEKYCGVRMVENKLLNKYLSYLHSDIYNYTNIRSYYITDAESRILNDINVRHCDSYYGKEHFTNKDLVVRLHDAHEFHQFLDICYNKIAHKTPKNSDRCGFIRINNESVVPFTVKGQVKYVPLFYFEGETESLKLKAETLEGWDLAYLKFCCKVQGIRNELFASETCGVISLDDIKSYFPAGTQFDDYWPDKVQDAQLIAKGPVSNASWTKQPAGAAPVVNKTVAQAVRYPPATAVRAQAQTTVANATMATPLWNNMMAVQQQQQVRMAQAMATNGQRTWAANGMNQAYFPYQMNQQQQQQQQQPNVQKPLPPPLVRTTMASNQVQPHMVASNGMADTRQYNISKTIAIQRMTAAANSRYNGYGAEAVDLSGPQHAQVQYTNGTGRVVKDARVVQMSVPQTNVAPPPYYLDNHYVDGHLVPCLCSRYQRDEQPLIPLTDFTHSLFPHLPPQELQKILTEVLKVTLYKANDAQMEVLRTVGKVASNKQTLAMIRLGDANSFLPQLRYVANNKLQPSLQQQSEPTSKRMRIS